MYANPLRTGLPRLPPDSLELQNCSIQTSTCTGSARSSFFKGWSSTRINSTVSCCMRYKSSTTPETVSATCCGPFLDARCGDIALMSIFRNGGPFCCLLTCTQNLPMESTHLYAGFRRAFVGTLSIPVALEPSLAKIIYIKCYRQNVDLTPIKPPIHTQRIYCSHGGAVSTAS